MKTRKEAIDAASRLFDLLDPEESRAMHITFRYAKNVRSLVVRHDEGFAFPVKPEEWETLPVVYEVRIPR
ncbi:hypothetical protein N9917_01440 [Deltaproteobacteria bacterium]|nr:hypothetical protein [Deltaproteobacteria bacterium]